MRGDRGVRRNLQRPKPNALLWVLLHRGDVVVDIVQADPQQRVRGLCRVPFVQSSDFQRRELQRVRGRLRRNRTMLA
jgi:hypothetical protein